VERPELPMAPQSLFLQKLEPPYKYEKHQAKRTPLDVRSQLQQTYIEKICLDLRNFPKFQLWDYTYFVAFIK
jgi:hypothetical protein